MAYLETTADSPEDLIDVIVTFAQANGWTVDGNTIDGSLRTAAIHRSGDIVMLYNENTTSLVLRGCTAYNPANPPASQTNVSNPTPCNLGAGPYSTVYLFTDTTPAEHVYAVVQTTGGIYYHIALGMLEKFGTYTGGTFFDSLYWKRTTASQVFRWGSQHSALFDYGLGVDGSTDPLRCGNIRCDIPADGITNAWAQMGRSFTEPSTAHRVRSGLYSGLTENTNGASWLTTHAYTRNAAPFSAQVMLGTIRFDVYRDGVTPHWSPIGTVPNLRYLNMQRYSAGQEISVGGDTWKVFPMIRYGVGSDTGVADNPWSDYHGYAYKKVV